MAKKANAAFMKALTPSEDLAKVVGSKPLPRTEVVSKLWAYIKKNNLQDKKNRRQINADDKLKALFGGKASVTMRMRLAKTQNVRVIALMSDGSAFEAQQQVKVTIGGCGG